MQGVQPEQLLGWYAEEHVFKDHHSPIFAAIINGHQPLEQLQHLNIHIPHLRLEYIQVSVKLPAIEPLPIFSINHILLICPHGCMPAFQLSSSIPTLCQITAS